MSAMGGWDVAFVDCSSSGIVAPQLPQILDALQKQVDRDFSPIWGVRAQLRAYEKTSDVPAHAWPIAIVDDLGCAGGIHLHDERGPYAQVTGGANMSVALSHELLEMLVNPWGNRFVLGHAFESTCTPRQVFYLAEVCDPCETFSYQIDGVRVSNFVFPAFYRGPASVAVDFVAALDGPLSVPSGCYLSWIDPMDGRWRARLPDGSVAIAHHLDAPNTSCRTYRDVYAPGTPGITRDSTYLANS